MSETSRPFQVIASVTALRKSPSREGARETQMLAGEVFHVLDHVDGWAQGVATLDGYEGWVKLDDLAEPALIPTIPSRRCALCLRPA